MQQQPETAYEPILVKTTSGKYKLVDFHQLLLAYSQIHTLILVELQQVAEQSRVAKVGFRDLQQNIKSNLDAFALGQLQCISSLGEGTEFIIKIPV